MLLVRCFLSFLPFLPLFYYIYIWTTQALSTRIEPGLEQQIVLPRDSYLQVYILAQTHIHVSFYACACVQTVYVFLQGYFNNVSEYLRIGPPLYFVVKNYNYRYFCPIMFCFASTFMFRELLFVEFVNVPGCITACVSGRNINAPCSLVTFQISMVITHSPCPPHPTIILWGVEFFTSSSVESCYSYFSNLSWIYVNISLDEECRCLSLTLSKYF